MPRSRLLGSAKVDAINEAIRNNSDAADNGLRRKTISLVPNLVTIFALAAGLSAIHYASNGKIPLAETPPRKQPTFASPNARVTWARRSTRWAEGPAETSRRISAS